MRNIAWALISAFISALILASCASLDQPTDVIYSQRLDRINAEYESSRVTGMTPWISDQLTDPRYVARFEKETCGLAPDPRRRKPSAVAKCHSKLRDVFEAEIAQQYPMIDKNDLEIQCNTSPEHCRDFRIYEGWARSSQNETLANSRSDRIAELNRWREAREARAQRRAEEMAGVTARDGDGPAPDPQLTGGRAPSSTTGQPGAQANASKPCPKSARHYNWWTAFCTP